MPDSENTRRNQLRWHRENYEYINIGVKKGKRAAYNKLSKAKNVSLSRMIQGYLDSEYEKQFHEKIE